MRIQVTEHLFDHPESARRVAMANAVVDGWWQMPAAPGWYYFSAQYPEDGAVGPFASEQAAERAAAR
jgi:hypothetical protein